MIQYIYPFFVFVVLVFLLFKKFHINGFPKWVIPFSFILKTILGSFFVYYFLNIGFKTNEPSDVYRFLNEGKLLNNIFYKSPQDYFGLLIGYKDYYKMNPSYFQDAFIWKTGHFSVISDTRNLIRIHSLIHFISFNNYYIHILLLNCLSLFGIIKLTKTFSTFSSVNPIIIYFIILISPSILFWSSGILKEPFILLGVSFITSSLFGSKKLSEKVIEMIMGIFILTSIKPYILICLIPTILFYLISFLFKEKALIKTFILFFIIIISVLSIPKIQSKITNNFSKKQHDIINTGEGGIHLSNRKHVYYITPDNYKNIKIINGKGSIKHRTFAYVYDKSKPFDYPNHILIEASNEKLKIKEKYLPSNSFFNVTRIDYSFKQLILNIPEALFNAFFRPLPFDNGGGILKYMSVFEVFALSIFIIISIFKRRKITETEFKIIFSLLIFAFALLLLIGWTTPISGLIVRYRFPAQLAIILACIILINPITKFKKNEIE